jgi:hypothetical protein
MLSQSRQRNGRQPLKANNTTETIIGLTLLLLALLISAAYSQGNADITRMRNLQGFELQRIMNADVMRTRNYQPSELVRTMDADVLRTRNIQYFESGSGSNVPTIISCNFMGAAQASFDLNETIYVVGSGYAPLGTYDLYVVNDTQWIDGMTIPSRVPNTLTSITSDVSGNVTATTLWNATLSVGTYDIVVDVNGNGKYDVGVDALDHNRIANSAGFLVVPEYSIEAILACFALSAALVTIRIYESKSRQLASGDKNRSRQVSRALDTVLSCS